MFGTLQSEPKVKEVVDFFLVERLKNLSWKANNGKFVAVKLSGEYCGKSASCYGAKEVGEFLNKIGFERDTTIYVTQTRGYKLDALRDIFPNAYTKENLILDDKRAKFLNSRSFDNENIRDFHVCSRSDVFVPAVSGLFYHGVVGMRIASGRTQILVPSKVKATSFASDYVSAYISERNHIIYSCYC